MATTNELITALTNQITGFASSQTEKLDSLDAAADLATAAAALADVARAALGSTTSTSAIHVDSINGDDGNDGLTRLTAVKTWAKMWTLVEQNKSANVNLYAPLIADTFIYLINPPPAVNLNGFKADGSATENQKITFIDATNTGSFPAGVLSYAPFTLRCVKVDMELDTTRAAGIFNASAHMEIFMRQAEITRIGTGTGALFSTSQSAHLNFATMVLDASAAGYLITNVAAAADPNAVAGISANFTSA